MKELTEKQQAVYAFIRAYQRKTGNSPTYQIIAEGFLWGSPNAAAGHVAALKRKGVLDKTRRGIALPCKPRMTANEKLAARNRVLDKLTEMAQEAGEYD